MQAVLKTQPRCNLINSLPSPQPKQWKSARSALSSKALLTPRSSISFYLGFLILFIQSMTGGKKWLLTLWMSYDGVHRRRVLFYIFAAVAASLATALSFDQFIHHCNNAVQALPHTGPHPVLKRAWVSLWIFIAKPRWGKIRWIHLRTVGRGAIMQTEWL